MDLDESITLIKSFFRDDVIFGNDINTEISSALEKEKGITFPPEFKKYINSFAANTTIDFIGVGNPREVYSRQKLSWLMDGYNFNAVRNEPIDDWNDDWFIFADEGGDPVIIKLNEKNEHSVVYEAMHGAGVWEFYPIADSIGQYLLCAAAVHHALDGFDIEEPISDDENGFNLVDEPAAWLFPFMKKHVVKYHDEWISVFENSKT